MWPLRRKKSAKPSREQVLGARPLRLVEESPEPDGKGGARLKIKLRQAKWAGMFVRLPDSSTKTFEFDEIGLLVWNNCDGKTTVKRLIEAVASKCKVSLREAEVSTFAFLQMLAKKNLVGIEMEKKD